MRVPKEAWAVIASIVLEVVRFLRERMKKRKCDEKP